MIYDRRHVYVRSPLRVSFVGGGTDLESYYAQHQPGHVVSAAIDLYVYAAMKDMFDVNVRVHHAEIETEPIASRIQHAYTRVALEEFGLFRGVEVILTSDIMTTGSGLGASSSIMASLIACCASMRDMPLPEKHEFAELVYELECKAGTIGGRQDQYATVYGGFNSITFTKERIDVCPVRISIENRKELAARCFLVYTNLARRSEPLQRRLRENARETKSSGYFDQLRQLSYQFLDELQAANLDIRRLGAILHEGWQLKKETNGGTSNRFIDQLYGMLRQKGVLGGKILGAGGGGFFLGFVESPEQKQRIKYELYPNYITLDFSITDRGTELVWKNV